jgi:hypothetical protein
MPHASSSISTSIEYLHRRLFTLGHASCIARLQSTRSCRLSCLNRHFKVIKMDVLDILIAHKAINLIDGLTGTDRRVGGAILAHYNLRTSQCDPLLRHCWATFSPGSW